MTDLYAGVVGQERAVRQLRAAAVAPVHAYLLVGPAGVGKRSAALAFAAHLLCASGGGCGECVECRRALASRHPDLVVVERAGASISVAQVDEILRIAARSAVEGARKVLVLVDVHLLAQQYPRLLKTLEEPAAGTVFVLLAEHVPPELVTVASRCVRIDFGPVAPAAIEQLLVSEGAPPGLAAEVAVAAGGRVDRARLLVDDPGFAARQAAWRNVPAVLDGTGATVAALADRLLGSVDSLLQPLRARQAEELAAFEERARAQGERAGGAARKELDDRHKREQRRLRLDELRFGLATLAGAYRDLLVEGRAGSDAAAVAAVSAVQAAAAALIRNPNEVLLLQGLLVRLTEAAEGAVS